MKIFLSELKKHKFFFFWFVVQILLGVVATLSSLPVIVFFFRVFLYGGDHIQDLNDIGSRNTRHLLKHAKLGSCLVRELST